MQYTQVFVDSGVPPAIITPEDMTPLLDGIVANIGVLLPVVLGLAAIFFGIKIIPSLISRFSRFWLFPQLRWQIIFSGGLYYESADHCHYRGDAWAAGSGRDRQCIGRTPCWTCPYGGISRYPDYSGSGFPVHAPVMRCGGGGLSGHRQFFRRCFPDV